MQDLTVLSMTDMVSIMNQEDTTITRQIEVEAIASIYPNSSSTLHDENDSLGSLLKGNDFSCELNFERD
jgi:hypothetical protein